MISAKKGKKAIAEFTAMAFDGIFFSETVTAEALRRGR